MGMENCAKLLEINLKMLLDDDQKFKPSIDYQSLIGLIKSSVGLSKDLTWKSMASKVRWAWTRIKSSPRLLESIDLIRW